jgi:hypothetical protein
MRENNSIAEKRGTTLYKPTKKKNSRVLNLTKTISEIKKSRDAVNIWLTKPKPRVFSVPGTVEKIINNRKFICTVVEKAITTLESICISILSVESITPTTAKK